MAKIKYVKLAAPFQGVAQADIEGGSGWSISGLDVKEYPDERYEQDACTYVDNLLKAARLVPATKAEYEAVQKQRGAFAEAVLASADSPTGHQESTVQAAARKVTRGLQEMFDGDESEDDEEDDLPSKSKLRNMSNDDLHELATNRGIDTAPSDSKEDIIAKLTA